jgi:hypothetical protein
MHIGKTNHSKERANSEFKIGTLMSPVQLIVCIVVLLLQTACNREKKLPNGYTLTSVEHVPADCYLILNKQRDCVVGENITWIGRHGDLVFGKVEKSEALDGSQSPNTRDGFFIVDTVKGTVSAGMAETEWRLKLTGYGVPTTVRLVAPHKF